jgi:type II restriction enzyme
MQRITGYNLVAFIDRLPKNQDYHYIDPKNHGLIRITRVKLPEGPIYIKRWKPTKGEFPDTKKEVPISTEMIWRVANACFDGQPINIDRTLGASYNTRSVLESLLAHTPQFYYCYPGRIQDIAGHSRVERGHKHIIWMPNNPHENARLTSIETKVAISEIPANAAVYEALTLPDSFDIGEMNIDVARRHTQIQIALYLIGKQLDYRTWIARNDAGIIYQEKPLIEQEGIVLSLQNENLVSPFPGAVDAGLFIDCIWFRNTRLMPAVMEVEHTTGVKSGLDRMLHFSQLIPPINTRYVIVAPDEDRERVVSEANKPMYRELNARYFPYSAVEELFVICQRRKLRGVIEEFLDCYMEPILSV